VPGIYLKPPTRARHRGGFNFAFAGGHAKFLAVRACAGTGSGTTALAKGASRTSWPISDGKILPQRSSNLTAVI